MPDPRLRSESLVAEVFLTESEPKLIEVTEKVALFLKFWITYSQTQMMVIEEPGLIVEIVQLCITGHRSIDIAEMLSNKKITITKDFIDRIFIRIKRLTYIILQEEFYELDFLPAYFELSEEEARVYEIYKTFSSISNEFALRSRNRKFVELAKYNPHYLDFLTMFSTGGNVADKMIHQGISMGTSKRASVSTNIIEALVNHRPRKNFSKDAQALASLTFFHIYSGSDLFRELLRRSFNLYLENSDKNLLRFTEVRRFIEIIIRFINPEFSKLLNSVTSPAEMSSILSSFLNNNPGGEIFIDYVTDLIRVYSREGNFDFLQEQLKYVNLNYSKHYSNDIFTAAINIVFSCVLITIYPANKDLTNEQLIKWISRNRATECSTLLKILSDVEP